MSALDSLRWRRTGGWIVGISLIALGLYLRCFVFLKIGPGTILVFGTVGAGLYLMECAKKADQTLKKEKLPN